MALDRWKLERSDKFAVAGQIYLTAALVTSDCPYAFWILLACFTSASAGLFYYLWKERAPVKAEGTKL